MAKTTKTKKPKFGVHEILMLSSLLFNEFIAGKIKARIIRWKEEKDKDSKKKNVKARFSYIIPRKLKLGQCLTIEEFSFLTGIKFTVHTNGKMLHMFSLNTSCYLNKYCIARLKKGIGICKHCFSASWQMASTELFENVSFNTVVLRANILDKNIIPIIPYEIFRLESFGDVQNYIQVVNYFLFCYENPDCLFTIWTKNPKFFDMAIKKGYKKPSNLTIILSSLELNKVATYNKDYKYFIDKIFTVYTLDWLKNNNMPADFINCGGRLCIECQRCYKNAKNSEFYINEILKKDQKKSEEYYGIEINSDSVCSAAMSDKQVIELMDSCASFENFESLL